MGMLRSQTNHTGLEVNGVTLGAPIGPVRADGSASEPGDAMQDLFWAWDDSAFPYGEIDADGDITVDEVEL
jgi:hypothetical protein